jgi:hypothetical protein
VSGAQNCITARLSKASPKFNGLNSESETGVGHITSLKSVTGHNTTSLPG